MGGHLGGSLLCESVQAVELLASRGPVSVGLFLVLLCITSQGFACEHHMESGLQVFADEILLQLYRCSYKWFHFFIVVL